MHGFFIINVWDKWKCISLYFYSIVCFLWNMYLRTVFLWCSKEWKISSDAMRSQTSRRKCLLELFQVRSKDHQSNMSGTQLKFWPRKSIFENYKPIGGFVFKITKNNFNLWYFTEFIQTQKRYATSLDKIIILTEKLLIPNVNFSCLLSSLRTYFFLREGILTVMYCICVIKYVHMMKIKKLNFSVI